MDLKYISLCSGIEAASVAWGPLGWKPVFFSEIDAFPSAVLKYHFPDVENKGDMTKYGDWKFTASDVLIGGTPCQAFSIAGLRKGLDDPRGQLMLTYLAIIKKYKPRYTIWENVPGALSIDGGRPFATLLKGLEECGYGVAYRILDAEYFGVPQRRKRVFVVGCADSAGGWQGAAKILFEPEMLCGNSAQGKGKGKEAAGAAGKGAQADCATVDFSQITSKALDTRCLEPSCNQGGTFIADYKDMTLYKTHPNDSRIEECADGVADTVAARYGTGGGNTPLVLMDQGGKIMSCEKDKTGTLRAQTHGHEPIVMATAQANAEITTNGICPTLLASMGTGGTNVPMVNSSKPIVMATTQANAEITTNGICPTLCVSGGLGGGNVPMIESQAAKPIVCNTGFGCSVQPNEGDVQSKQIVSPDGVSPTLSSGTTEGMNIQPIVFDDQHTFASKADCLTSGYARCYNGNGQATNGSNYVREGSQLRRLLPDECARLQGFPDGWAQVPWKGKDKQDCPDAPQYKAYGNSMAVPVVRWLGQRIEMLESGQL